MVNAKKKRSLLLLLICLSLSFSFKILSSAEVQITPARFHGEMEYLPSKDQLILFGGTNENSEQAYLNDTWLFDVGNETWNVMQTTATPPPMAGHGMIYDDEMNQIILHFRKNCWTLNISSGTWNEINSTISPPSRTDAGFVFDQKRSLGYLFGGIKDYFAKLNDFWVLNGSAESWVKLNITSRIPSPRYGHLFIADPTNDRFYLFGGNSNQGKLNDLWVFYPSNSSWEEITPSSIRPSTRYWGAMEYDPLNNRLVLFSGSSNYPNIPTDTWIFDCNLKKWSELNLTNQPHRRMTPSLIFLTSANKMMLFGGHSSEDMNYPFGDIWYFDCVTDAWIESEKSVSIPESFKTEPTTSSNIEDNDTISGFEIQLVLISFMALIGITLRRK